MQLTQFHAFKVVLLFGLVLTGQKALALNFAQQPLFLANASIPNVSLMLDDSGSMDWGVLTRPHYDFCAFSYTAGRIPELKDDSVLVDQHVNITEDDKVCFLYRGELYRE